MYILSEEIYENGYVHTHLSQLTQMMCVHNYQSQELQATQVVIISKLILFYHWWKIVAFLKIDFVLPLMKNCCLVHLITSSDECNMKVLEETFKQRKLNNFISIVT